MAPKIELHFGDNLDILRTLPSGGISHVVTDPPYGQSNESYDKGVDPEVWRECFRVCKPNAALLSFAGSPTYHRIASGIEAAGWKVRQMWAWVYRNGMITSAYPREGIDRLAPAMTPIVFATKGRVLLRLQREGNGWRRNGERGGGYSHRSGVATNKGAAGHWPRQLVASPDVEGFEFFSSGQHPEEKLGHPNQKPLALMRWLVSKLPPCGIILDPYMGSGTTLIAAQQEGFDAIGIERDANYFEIVERRIAEARAEHPLLALQEEE